MSHRFRLSLLSHRYLHLTGLLAAGGFLLLAVDSPTYGEASVVTLLSVSIVVFMASVLLCWHYLHKSNDLPLKLIFLWACIFRLIGLFSYPLLEDDHYRFLWDGYQTVTTGSPYAKAPAEYFADDTVPPAFDDILSTINYPEVPTIYAPVTQFIFAVAYSIQPAQLWPLKIILLIFDIGLLFILLRFINTKNNSPTPTSGSWLNNLLLSVRQQQTTAFLLYAWSPLLIKEVAFTAHPDIIGVLFLFAALLLAKQATSHWIWIAVLCGLAVGSKIFAILIIPFVLAFNFRAWLVFCVTLVLVCLPFLADLLAMVSSLQTMGANWLFNAPIYFIFNKIWLLFFSSLSFADYASSLSLLKLICLGIFCLAWGVYYLGYFQLVPYSNLSDRVAKITLHGVPRGDYIYGIFVLAIPVVNPWYLLWLLPFAVIYPSLWAWLASIALMLSYIIGLNIEGSSLAAYQQPAWAITMEYALILVGAVIGFLLQRGKN